VIRRLVDPSERLPEEFAAWEAIAPRVSSLLLAGRLRSVVDALGHFRKTHFEIAVRCTTRQSPEPDEAQGTGGTSLATFLKKTCEETQARRLNES
jgi:hypothetical protein